MNKATVLSSAMKGTIPRLSMLHNCIQDRQHLPHTSGQCHLDRLSGGPQALVERSNPRIAPGGRDGCHIQDGANVSTAPADAALASPRPAIPVQWGDAYERGDRAAVKRSQFRQFGEQGATEDGADSRHALQQVVVLAPDRTAPDLLPQFEIQIGDPLLQPVDV